MIKKTVKRERKNEIQPEERVRCEEKVCVVSMDIVKVTMIIK